MLGIELITTRRRRKLEAAERDLKLNGIRRTVRHLVAEVQDARQVHVDCSTIPGGGYDDPSDADETRRLDRLLIDGRVLLSHLGDQDPVTEADIYGA